MATVVADSRNNELRKKAMKRVIELCEDSIGRNDQHMTIQCPKCENAEHVSKSEKLMPTAIMNL